MDDEIWDDRVGKSMLTYIREILAFIVAWIRLRRDDKIGDGVPRPPRCDYCAGTGYAFIGASTYDGNIAGTHCPYCHGSGYQLTTYNTYNGEQ